MLSSTIIINLPLHVLNTNAQKAEVSKIKKEEGFEGDIFTWQGMQLPSPALPQNFITYSEQSPGYLNKMLGYHTKANNAIILAISLVAPNMSPVTPPKILLDETIINPPTRMPNVAANTPFKPRSNTPISNEMTSETKYKLCLFFIESMKIEPKPFCRDEPCHAHVTIASFAEVSAIIRD